MWCGVVRCGAKIVPDTLMRELEVSVWEARKCPPQPPPRRFLTEKVGVFVDSNFYAADAPQYFELPITVGYDVVLAEHIVR